MEYGEALDNYLDAYNKLQALSESPLNQDGLEGSVAAMLTGSINVTLIRQYDDVVNKISAVKERQMADLQTIMDDNEPKIVELFTVKAAHLSEIFFETTMQKITIEGGLVVVSQYGV